MNRLGSTGRKRFIEMLRQLRKEGSFRLIMPVGLLTALRMLPAELKVRPGASVPLACVAKSFCS